MLPQKNSKTVKKLQKNSYKIVPNNSTDQTLNKRESNQVPPEHSTLYKWLFERSYSIAV